MQYYVSLPAGWEKGHAYPVAVVIESANRDFETNARVFADARKEASAYIVVAPLVVTNGGPNVRSVPSYHYSPAVWNQIERDPWKFDGAGISAIVGEVHRLFGGAEKIAITGWEAGCHTVWALLFNQPNLVAQAALVCPNYAGRWIKPFDHVTHLPTAIEVLAGERDTAWAPGKPLYVQTRLGIREAASRGFGRVPIRIVPGKGHGPLPEAVWSYFESAKFGG